MNASEEDLLEQRRAAQERVAGFAQRGVAFIERTGSELDRLLAARIAGQGGSEPLASACAKDLDGSQAQDPDRAWRWLARLADGHSLHVPVVEALCRGLEATQREDGSWQGADAALEARLVTTGLLCGHLARTPFARPEALEHAADFLAEHFKPERVKEGAWWNLAAYAQAFANFPHDASDGILQWCGRELERDYRTGLVDAVRAARVFHWCDTASLPGGALALGELVEPILALQQADGGWLDLADPSPAARVQLTLDAIAALTS